MRVPLSKVHRAFPELDRFSDEQCERFVRSACRRGWRPWIHRVVLGLLIFPLTAGSIFGAIAASSWAEKWLRLGDVAFWVVVGLALAGACLVPALLVMLLRDRLLLGRIRYLVRDRGVCPACRYSLLGVVVGEGNMVVCPECGLPVEADPSLKELVTDELGRVRFQPSERIAGRVFWTERRVRRAKRGAVGLAVLLLVVLPASLGGYELFLRQQAARAAAERPGIAGIMAFVEANQAPGTTAGDRNAWDVVLESVVARDAVRDRVTAGAEYGALASGYGGFIYPIWETIYEPEEREDDDPRRETDALNRRLCLDLLAEYGETGVLDWIDSIADAPRAVETVNAPPSQPAFSVNLTTLGDTRSFGRMNAARMTLARRDGDIESFLRAFECTLGLARLCAHQGPLIESLVAISLESQALKQARLCMLEHPGPAWLDGIEAAMQRQSPGLAPSHAVEGERLYMLDGISWAFANPDNVRLGRFSRIARMGGNDDLELLRMRLGTYAENRDAANTYFDAVARAAGEDPADRAAIAPYPRDLVLLSFLMPAMHRYLDAVDRAEADRRATALMLALERYRIDGGDYPESLDALVPGYCRELPRDPWTGGAFGYARRGDTYALSAAGREPGGAEAADSSDARRGIVYSPTGE